MKNSAFFEHGKMVFVGFIFSGFHVIVVCFWCVWHSSKSVKMLVFFPVLGAFVGWLILAYLGLGGLALGVFVFLVFVFLFVLLLFLFCLLCFCFVVGFLGCWFLFCCFFVFLLCLFFWRF